jgi:potassium-dependent mechanosensitive channel
MFKQISSRLKILALVGLTILGSSVWAQIPSIAAEKPAVADKADASETQLQLWLKEARATFLRLNEPDAEAQLPAGIDVAALADYRRDLERLIQEIGKHQKNLTTAQTARKDLEAARATDSEWTGFTEKPPFSVLMIDALLNQQDAVKEEAASYQSSLQLYTSELSEIQEKAKLSDEELRRSNTDAAPNAGDESTVKWKLAASQAKSRALAGRAMFLQSTIALLQDQSARAKVQFLLIDRQIATAKKQASLSDEDLVKVKKTAQDRRAILQKDLAAARERQKKATTARDLALANLDAIRKSMPKGASPTDTPELSLARAKLEAAETRINALQYVSENLESMLLLESYAPEVYQTRKTLLETKDLAIREAALKSLHSNYDRLKAREIVLANELAAINADLSKQESRASAMTSEDPIFFSINDLRASLWEKQASIQRVSQAISAPRRMLKRWLDEFDSSQVKLSFEEKLKRAAASTWEFTKKIWNFPVFKYEETVMMSGLAQMSPRAVTLGQFIIAILCFSAAYILASRIKDRLRNWVVSHGYIADAQAKTLSNWLMIAVGFLLAVATLQYLTIPLTIFAFLGGALVIGLGFGTQTLIKNFISGIIVLFERKIRVGDIVDIGGGAGTIIEINTRSSVLRGGDGKETLVPNSLFLENKVTNLTLSNRRVRRSMAVKSARNAAPQRVMEVLKDCVDSHGLILKEPGPIVTFEEFSDNAWGFAIFYWTQFNDRTNADVVASDIRLMIHKRFAEAAIDFPNTVAEAAHLPEPSQPELLQKSTE